MTTEHEPAGPGSLLTSQCWEDGETLIEALGVRPGETVVSVAAGGDNALGLLITDPARVIAADPSPAQIFCCQLKSRAFRNLGHGELLELNGSRFSIRRLALLEDALEDASPDERSFWQAVKGIQTVGIGGIGRLERELTAFRRRLLPCAAGQVKIDRVLEPKPATDRARFHDRTWDTVRWRMVYRVGFARLAAVSADYAGRKVRIGPEAGSGILRRWRQQLVDLDPSANPYLHWFLRGEHGDALPLAYQPRNHQVIRERLDRITWRSQSLEGVLGSLQAGSVDRFNLNGLFEHTSDAAYQHLLKSILRAARPGARLVYWNTLVERSRPESLRKQIRPLVDLAGRLNAVDRTLLSQRLVIEEVL